MYKKYSLLLALLLTVLILNLFFLLRPKNYILSSFTVNQRETVVLGRVIDGDTFVTVDGETIRLININTPEKKHKGSEEATEYLKTFENVTVELEKTGKEKYGRTLARAYFKGEYLNLKIVEKGLGNKFLVNQDEIKKFKDAEESAIKNFFGIWTISKYSQCIKLKVYSEKEIIKITNECEKINFKNWVIKDESRKEYKFKDISTNEVNLHSSAGKDNATDVYWNEKKDVWNDDRDTAYLFDEEKNLVQHETYGY